jgi:hypothetical protein
MLTYRNGLKNSAIANIINQFIEIIRSYIKTAIDNTQEKKEQNNHKS